MNTIFCKDNYFLLIIDCKKSDCFTFNIIDKSITSEQLSSLPVISVSSKPKTTTKG